MNNNPFKKHSDWYTEFEKECFFGNTFKIKFQEDYFKKGDLVAFSDKEKDTVKVISTPKMHYWQRFKKWMGWEYEWCYKVKKV